ncbi:MAG TPA: hypothetical protein VK706_02965 [Candidatus Sulfotelmatobacter sp.]|jgi:hypothetical protein|nr:hypothetical protein [Candidatus Sulfotelmatobacter sp.]
MGRSNSYLLVLGLSLGVAASAQTPAVNCSLVGNPQCAATQTRSGSQLSDPEKSSPNAPKVIYRNGQLTIRAVNSTLGEVLRAVSLQTGAVIEFPPGSVDERVVVNFGPGPVRDVVGSLLNGTHFNYVLLESPGNPSVLQRMILTSAEPTPSEPTPPTPPPVAQSTVPDLPTQTANAAPPQPTEPPVDDAHRQEMIDKIRERVLQRIKPPQP